MKILFSLKFYSRFIRIFIMGLVMIVLGISISHVRKAHATTAIDAETGIETAREVSLEELVAEALKKNPDIRAAEARWKAAKKLILASWALPDPMIGFDVMGAHTETRLGPQENRMMLSQVIPFPLKLWKKRQAAKAQAEAAYEEYEAVRREILTQLKLAYYDLYFIDQSLQIIDEVHNLLRRFESVAESRYANRSGKQRDVAKAQTEVSLTLEQVFQLEQMRETAYAKLNALLDRDPFGTYPTPQRPEMPQLHATLPEVINLAIRHQPKIKRMEALIREKRHLVSLAKLDMIPDVEVGFVYTWVGSGSTMMPDDGMNSWMIPLKFNVPLWQNRLIPEIQSAQWERQAAIADYDAAEQLTYFQIRAAYSRFQMGKKTTLLYETAVIPQSELALRSDEASYESGETDFLNLLDSERIFLNAKLTYLKIYTETLKSYAELENGTGLDLTGEPL